MNPYENIVEDLTSQGFSITTNFLNTEECQLLLRSIEPKKFQAARIGRGRHTQIAEAIRSDTILWWDEENLTSTQKLLWTKLGEVKQILNQELCLGLWDLELHYSHYAPGAKYQKHLDRHQETAARELSVVLYLNSGWHAEWGGRLHIYSPKGDKLRSVLPESGTLVLFLSEAFPHEVEKTQADRYSVSGWFRKRAI